MVSSFFKYLLAAVGVSRRAPRSTIAPTLIFNTLARTFPLSVLPCRVSGTSRAFTYITVGIGLHRSQRIITNTLVCLQANHSAFLQYTVGKNCSAACQCTC